MEKLTCSHQPPPGGYPFPYSYLSLQPERPSPRQLRLPSLAQNLSPTRRAMVRIIRLEGGGLHEDSPGSLQKLYTGRIDPWRGSR